jgi:hypothetical protein
MNEPPKHPLSASYAKMMKAYEDYPDPTDELIKLGLLVVTGPPETIHFGLPNEEPSTKNEEPSFPDSTKPFPTS